MLRFFDNASPYRALGDVDDGGGSWCSASSSSSSYDTQNSLCSAGATDISSYGIDSNGVAVDVDIKQGCYGSTACGGTVLFFYLCTSDGNFEITLDNSFTNEVNEDDEVSSAAVELEVSSANASTGTAAYAYASGTCDEYTSSLSSSASTNATTCTVEFLRDSDFPDCAAYIWSCGCSGDTYVRVEQASGALLAGMDDDSLGWCTSSDYRCSSGSIALPTGVSQLNLRQGCFSQGTCGGAFSWYLTCTGTAASSGSGGSPSTTPTTPIFSAPPENYNSENNDNSTSYGPTSVYTYTSTDPSTNTVYTYAYGGCDPFYQSAGTGFSACDVYAPAMDEASTCEIRLYGCYCTGDTVLTFPTLGSSAIIDDDTLSFCTQDQSRCSTGLVTTNVSASHAATRLTMQQQCFGATGACGGSTSWTTRCFPSGAQAATWVATAPPTASSELNSVVISGDYTNTAPNEDAVGVYISISFENAARAALDRNSTQFKRTVAAALSTRDYTVTPPRITFVSPFTDVTVAVTGRRLMAGTIQTVQIELSVLAPNVAVANAMVSTISTGTLTQAIASAMPGVSVSLLSTPVVGNAIFAPVFDVGKFDTSPQFPMKPGELVFGTYPQAQCLQARASSLFLEADSHTLNTSGAAFKLELKSAISASLAIGFYALEEGEASLVRLSDFYILKKNSSVQAVPRVSVAKKRFLKPYKASVNQLLAITQGEEDALYERQQWVFKLDRLEVESDEVSSAATASGKSTNTKTTTLKFHPFFFNFVCEVTEQYYTFDDVQAFTAMITYITYFITIAPFMAYVPKGIRMVRRACQARGFCGGKKNMSPRTSELVAAEAAPEM